MPIASVMRRANVGGVLSVLGAEEVGGLVGADAGLVDRAGEHEGDLVEELVAVGQLVGVADGPEPGRTSSP